MKNIFIFLAFGLLFFNFISALDQELPNDICGGDDQLVISCLSDEQLIFIGGVPAIGSTSGDVLRTTTIPKEEPKESLISPFFSIFPFFGLGEGEIYLDIALIVFFLVIFLLLIMKKKKRPKMEENKENRNV